MQREEWGTEWTVKAGGLPAHKLSRNPEDETIPEGTGIVVIKGEHPYKPKHAEVCFAVSSESGTEHYWCSRADFDNCTRRVTPQAPKCDR